jgi:hypothetical protein
VKLDVALAHALGNNAAGLAEWRALIKLDAKPGGATAPSDLAKDPALRVA